jgi:hypothetical protein
MERKQRGREESQGFFYYSLMQITYSLEKKMLRNVGQGWIEFLT